MAHERDVVARGDVPLGNRLREVERAELDEVIARARSSELHAGPVLVLAGHAGDGPVLIQHRMMVRAVKPAAHAEAGPASQHVGEHVPPGVENLGVEGEDRQLHAAGDIDPDGVGDDGVFTRQHPANGEAITDVGIGHQRAAPGDRERTRIGHLAMSADVDVGSPGGVRDATG